MSESRMDDGEDYLALNQVKREVSSWDYPGKGESGCKLLIQNRHSETEFIWTSLITISRNKNGGADKETLRLMERLAEMYAQGAIFESAIPLKRFIFNVRRHNLGLAHRDTEHAMETLAVNLEARELWKEVEYRKALPRAERGLVGS